MEALDHQKNVWLVLVKRTQTFVSFHYNGDNSYLFVNWNEILKFKADNKNAKFKPLNGIDYDFSFNYKSIDKSDMLNLRKMFNGKE